MSTLGNRREFECFEITHDGEGDRGQHTTVVSVPTAHAAAAAASQYFDDIEKQRERLADSDFDGTSRVIEVQGVNSSPRRFRVRCCVTRSYTAMSEL